MEDDNDFFEIVDSHPMTDEEANQRLRNIDPSKLPSYEHYHDASIGLKSADPDWVEDYRLYNNAWSDFLMSLVTPGGKVKPWTAESRKALIEMELFFESTAIDWIG